jgi:hypothetical protein
VGRGDGEVSVMATQDAAEVVAGRYRLLSVVGTGGMGQVWRAHDMLLDRVVAAKQVTGLAGPDGDDLREQVVHEARMAARLDHPNVVGVLDVVDEAHRFWIIMEFVAARSLHEILTDDGPLSHAEAARIGIGVLRALRAAHAAGILHSDVKPHNVMVGAEGRIVLTDLGLAHPVAPAPVRRTPAAVLGSPYFLAPERLGAGAGSVAGDLWSFGCTLYAAVEGRSPFARPTTAESLAALTDAEPDPPRHPGPLHPIIARLLVRDPRRRATADETLAALTGGGRRAVGVARVPAPRPPESGTATALATVLAPAMPTRRPRALIVAACALAAATATGGIALAATHEDPPVAAAPAPASAAVTPPTTAAAFVACGTGAPAQRMMGSSSPIALPAGWVWHKDSVGFQFAVPAGWTRSVVGRTLCFRDPGGTRGLIVDRDPPASWQQRERQAVAAGDLPRYHRVSLSGASWEYTWQPAGGPRLHSRRVLASRYALQWIGADRGWAADAALPRRIAETFS